MKTGVNTASRTIFFRYSIIEFDLSGEGIV
jgi:hypothetical protein